jgi:CheY-like chemotaxis protein
MAAGAALCPNGAMSSVLVADDSAVMRKAIRMRLEAGGVDTVIEAEDGFETIAKVLTEEPNVVVLDIVMTRLNGLETLKELRKLRPHLPVIVHTRYAEALKYQGLPTGETTVVSKGDPLVPAVLTAIDSGARQAATRWHHPNP